MSLRRAGVWTIVVAGGSGNRFGSRKQFSPLEGKTLVEWAVEPALAVSEGVVLVVPADSIGDTLPAVDAVVGGGTTRAESVRAGLVAVPPGAGVIVVHDAARPLASVALFESVIAAVADGADGAIPGIPVSDTLKRTVASTGGARHVTSTVDREGVVAVQTPQAFRAAILRRAHKDGGESTDDAALVEEGGGTVVVVDGEPGNLKVTSPSDIERAAYLLGMVQGDRLMNQEAR